MHVYCTLFQSLMKLALASQSSLFHSADGFNGVLSDVSFNYKFYLDVSPKIA